MESISSMNIILGLSFLATSNRVLNVFSDYPTYFDIKSEAEMLKKVPPCISVAQAFASRVLPVPGGPYRSMPLQGVLSPTNTSGNLIGNMTASWRTFLAWSSPPTSSHLTLGFYLTMASEILLNMPCSSLLNFLSSTV